MPKEVTSETSIPSTDSIEASKENSTSMETIDLTCTLKTSDEEVPAVDVISDTTPSAIQVVEEANTVEASPLTSEQLY
jgi:galactitol-specific phosphotransferase system IIB component